MRGRFISIEGGEGVGKSSNIAHICRLIEAQGQTVIATREPGGTPAAERIREVLLHADDEVISQSAELLLMFASRALHVDNVIRPALDAGTWVVCDRFTDATRAYQGAGRGFDRKAIDTVADWVHADTWPDLTLLLDAPVEIGMARVSRRGPQDRIEREQLAFFERVRQGYLALAEEFPDRIKVVDATGSPDEVAGLVSAILTRSFFNKSD